MHEGKVRESPWGEILEEVEFFPGLNAIMTPGHTGFRLSREIVEAQISSTARSRLIEWDGKFWFSGSGPCAMMCFEMEDIARAFAPHMSEEERRDPRAFFIGILSATDPSYLLARGIAPDPAGLAQFAANEARAREVVGNGKGS